VTGRRGPCGCGCALNSKTSKGFEAVKFSEDVLKFPLLPWQRWLFIHMLELTPDGSFRFRTVLTLIARQNGKTKCLMVLALYFMYMGHAQLVLGAAQSLDISRESWRAAVDMAQSVPELAEEIRQVMRSTVEYSLVLDSGARYRITAANDKAGRGLSVDLLILDELRTYKDTNAWAALSNTTMARPNSIIVGISNAGDDQSVVLNELRAQAIAGLDPSMGLFEWSAPDGCALDDRNAWAQANPGLGHTITEQKLRSAMLTQRPADYKTENLCMRVASLDSAVDPEAWRACADSSVSLEHHLANMVMAVDVAMDSGHVTAAAAVALEDGTVLGEIFEQWPSVDAFRSAFPRVAQHYKPRACAWFPSGPAAVVGAELKAQHLRTIGAPVFDPKDAPPDAPGVVPFTGADASAACQTLASLVVDRKFKHSDDPLLNAHIAGSIRRDMGDGWRFARRGAGDNDAAYAMAGAVHLARSIPRRADYDVLKSVF